MVIRERALAYVGYVEVGAGEAGEGEVGGGEFFSSLAYEGDSLFVFHLRRTFA